MSKKKKSLDDLLEEALVPEEEQPYELPKNWIWTYNKNISNIIRGLSYKKHDVVSKSDNTLLVLRGGNIQNGKLLNQDDNVYVHKNLIPHEKVLLEDDIVLVSSTGSSKVIGKAAVVNEDFIGQTFGAFITLIRPNEHIYKKYLGLYFQSGEYRKLISMLAKGSNINNIKTEHLEKLVIPLPPLLEQKRIVEKITTLFSKIDKGKQLLEEAKETFELRRATILDKAFRGKLIQFDVSYKKLGNFVTLKSGKSISAENLAEHGNLPYVKVSDMNAIENQKEIVSSKSFIIDDEKYQNALFPKGTVIFPKRGGAIHTNKKRILSTPAMCDLNIMGIICPDTVDPYYMYYWMQSVDLRKLDNGSSVPQINNKDIEPLQFPLTSLEKQKELVQLLDRLLSKENQSIEGVNSALKMLDYLKQSILSEAFKGNLGTNNLEDEQAITLLKTILQKSC